MSGHSSGLCLVFSRVFRHLILIGARVTQQLAAHAPEGFTVESIM